MRLTISIAIYSASRRVASCRLQIAQSFLSIVLLYFFALQIVLSWCRRHLFLPWLCLVSSRVVAPTSVIWSLSFLTTFWSFSSRFSWQPFSVSSCSIRSFCRIIFSVIDKLSPALIWHTSLILFIRFLRLLSACSRKELLKVLVEASSHIFFPSIAGFDYGDWSLRSINYKCRLLCSRSRRYPFSVVVLLRFRYLSDSCRCFHALFAAWRYFFYSPHSWPSSISRLDLLFLKLRWSSW